MIEKQKVVMWRWCPKVCEPPKKRADSPGRGKAKVNQKQPKVEQKPWCKWYPPKQSWGTALIIKEFVKGACSTWIEKQNAGTQCRFLTYTQPNQRTMDIPESKVLPIEQEGNKWTQTGSERNLSCRMIANLMHGRKIRVAPICLQIVKTIDRSPSSWVIRHTKLFRIGMAGEDEESRCIDDQRGLGRMHGWQAMILGRKKL